MPGKAQVQAQCDRLNRIRFVRTRSRQSLVDFWAQAGGSFVIEGGSEESRVRALVAKLGREMSWHGGSTVVLTTSRSLETSLISWVQKSGQGFLKVCSPSYPSYDYFYGWDDAEIAGYLVTVAQEMGISDQRLVQLIAAFVSVLGRCYRPSLGSMRTLASYDISQVALLGERQGVASYHVTALRTIPAETMSALRMLLDRLAQILPSSSLGAETGENISAVSHAAMETYLVNMSSPDPSATNAYFAHELDRALNRGMVSRVVLADVPLLSSGPLVDTLLGAQMRGVEVGVSLLNASRMLQRAESDLGGLVFGSRVLFLDGPGFSAGDLVVALQPLGTYQYHYPQLSAPGMTFFDVFGTKNEWSMATEERLRVRPEDTVGFALVLFGADGRDVCLARSYD